MSGIPFGTEELVADFESELSEAVSRHWRAWRYRKARRAEAAADEAWAAELAAINADLTEDVQFAREQVDPEPLGRVPEVSGDAA